MTTNHLHIIGIDPGGTTGYARFTIPRASMFGREPSRWLGQDYGEFTGPEPLQAIEIARYIRATQSLDFRTGPAVVIEDWTIDPTFKSTDPESLSPVRIGAMLALLKHQNLLGDATLTFQNRALAFSTVTDDRLRRWCLWTPGSDHIRAATRHAVTALRRARADSVLASAMWPR